ncbi:hypothetical protein [Weissella kandleri]|uniref:hypothetical protein n=1 Tax=Weissella kandleri TaxID=1616 RepID=UPI00070F8313|nr:hypothetical protein [Weissella kandleri]
MVKRTGNIAVTHLVLCLTLLTVVMSVIQLEMRKDSVVVAQNRKLIRNIKYYERQISEYQQGRRE